MAFEPKPQATAEEVSQVRLNHTALGAKRVALGIMETLEASGQEGIRGVGFHYADPHEEARVHYEDGVTTALSLLSVCTLSEAALSAAESWAVHLVDELDLGPDEAVLVARDGSVSILRGAGLAEGQPVVDLGTGQPVLTASEELSLYHELHDGLNDMLEGGRLSEGSIPDDFKWLESSLVKITALQDQRDAASILAKDSDLAFRTSGLRQEIEGNWAALVSNPSDGGEGAHVFLYPASWNHDEADAKLEAVYNRLDPLEQEGRVTINGQDLDYFDAVHAALRQEGFICPEAVEGNSWHVN